MPDNNEPTLRNALDAVNASRKWTLLGISALFFAILILVAFVFSMLIPSMHKGVTVDVATGAPSIEINRLMPLKALWISLAVQMFFTGLGTIAVMLHVSRMTRAVLRAIESTRR